MAIEVIESKLSHSDEMIQRFPEYGTGEIKWGAQLTVTDGEWGVFFRDGKALEVFDSGRHVLLGHFSYFGLGSKSQGTPVPVVCIHNS